MAWRAQSGDFGIAEVIRKEADGVDGFVGLAIEIDAVEDFPAGQVNFVDGGQA